MRADPENPAAIAAAIEVALDRRDELVSRGLAHAARFSWSQTGRVILDAYVEAVLMRVGLDVSPLDQTRAGTARYIEGIDELEDVELVRLRTAAPAGGDSVPRCVVVPVMLPRLAKRKRLDVLHCPTFRGPIHARRCRWSLPFTTSPSCATQRRSTGGRGATAARVVPRVARAASRVIAVSEFTKRELVELLGTPPGR